MKSLPSVSQRNKGQEMNPSLNWTRCVVSQDHVTLEYITKRGYGISNPTGLQEKAGKRSVLEVHHSLGPNDCFRPLAVLGHEYRRLQ